MLLKAPSFFFASIYIYLLSHLTTLSNCRKAEKEVISDTLLFLHLKVIVYPAL